MLGVRGMAASWRGWLMWALYAVRRSVQGLFPWIPQGQMAKVVCGTGMTDAFFDYYLDSETTAMR
jgi:hypothetical protein